MKQPCSKRVYSGQWSRPHDCTRNGTVEYEGKYYCKQHDPVKKEEKNRAKVTKWKMEQDKRREEFNMIGLFPEFKEALAEWWYEATGRYDKKSCGHLFTCVCTSDRVREALKKVGIV